MILVLHLDTIYLPPSICTQTAILFLSSKNNLQQRNMKIGGVRSDKKPKFYFREYSEIGPCVMTRDS